MPTPTDHRHVEQCGGPLGCAGGSTNPKQMFWWVLPFLNGICVEKNTKVLQIFTKGFFSSAKKFAKLWDFFQHESHSKWAVPTKMIVLGWWILLHFPKDHHIAPHACDL